MIAFRIVLKTVRVTGLRAVVMTNWRPSIKVGYRYEIYNNLQSQQCLVTHITNTNFIKIYNNSQQIIFIR